MSERIIELEQINSRLMESESEMFGELQHQDKQILELKKENTRLTELLESQYKIIDNLCETIEMLQEQLLEKGELKMNTQYVVRMSVSGRYYKQTTPDGVSREVAESIIANLQRGEYLEKENEMLRSALGELSPQTLKLVDAEMEGYNG